MQRPQDEEYEPIIDQEGNQFSSRQIVSWGIIVGAVCLAVFGCVLFVILWRGTSKHSPSYLEDAVDVKNIVEHLKALENLATENNGTRAVGTTGYNASLQYVMSKLLDNTDYNISLQQFNAETWSSQTSPVFRALPPASVNYTEGVDFNVLRFSGSGNVTASKIVAAANFGCNESDFGEFAWKIVLVLRGNCTFQQKVDNAVAVDAAAVIVYNYDEELISGALTHQANSVPVISVSNSLGLTLSSSAELYSISVAASFYEIPTWNLLATTRTGNASNRIVVGSHLDSVPAGPGINDNGSGACSNLEVAIQLSKLDLHLENQIVFAWWGAEEVGLQGSNFFVEELQRNPEEFASVVMNMNFDMLGSPNWYRGVDRVVSGNASVLKSSAVVQAGLEDYFEQHGLVYEFNDVNAEGGRSDYAAFLAAGIAASGLATGAEKIKSVEQRSEYGGLANAAFDPCYHQACDTVDNVAQDVLHDMACALAHAVQLFAQRHNLREFLHYHPTTSSNN